MAITTDDQVWKFGSLTQVSVASPASVAANAFSVAGDVNIWTNTDDATDGTGLLKCQFSTTMPTGGNIELYAQLMDIDGTNDGPVPDANYKHVLCGVFQIDYGVTAGTDFYTYDADVFIPSIVTAQKITWFILNNNTAQTIASGWKLWIGDKVIGPK